MTMTMTMTPQLHDFATPAPEIPYHDQHIISYL